MPAARRILSPLVLLALLALPALVVPGTPSAAAPPGDDPSLEALGFLAGAWVAGSGGTRVEEQWLCPSGGLMVGMGRTTGEPGEAPSFEFLRIEKRPSGIVYVAQPGGRAPTEFRLVRLQPGRAVFENPEHDFPKRISYTHEADGGLTARVEGEAPGGRSVELRYRSQGAGCR